MPIAGIVTLTGITLAVLAIAGYLLHVIFLLNRTSFALGTVVAGLRAIELQTRPVRDIVSDINVDLDTVKGALEGILGMELTGEYPGRDVRPAYTPVPRPPPSTRFISPRDDLEEHHG